MKNKNSKTQKQNASGFMALMSAIIISVILLLIVTSLSSTSFYMQSNILDSELKERSSALAEACADSAILKLINDPSYNPSDESVTVGGDICVIKRIRDTEGRKVIEVRADYRSYITNLEVEVDSDMLITHFEEK